jgi:hypothetical protein
LLTGVVDSPQQVREHVEQLRADGRLPLWNDFLSEPALGSLTMSELISVTEVIEAHLNELPDGSRESIRAKLSDPLGQPYMTAMQTLVRSKGYWTEEHIQNRWVSIVLMAPPVLEWWQNEAADEFKHVQMGSYKMVGYKQMTQAESAREPQLIKDIRRRIQQDILKRCKKLWGSGRKA